ncbi:MAG: hypothetical protein ACO242_03585 [Candidatus Fonsibacter ubiquis]
MHFALPENLKVQVLAYDATLKKLAQESAAPTKKGQRDKSKRFGVPDDLFPEYIATPERQKAAAAAINNSDATHGWGLVAPNKKALLAYYNNVWTAVWEDDEHGLGIVYLSKGTGNTFVDKKVEYTLAPGISTWQITVTDEVAYSSNPKMKWRKTRCTLSSENRKRAALGVALREMGHYYSFSCTSARTSLPNVWQLLPINEHRNYRDRSTAGRAADASRIKFTGDGRIPGLGSACDRVLVVAPFPALMHIIDTWSTECYHVIAHPSRIASKLQEGCPNGIYDGKLTLEGFNWFCALIANGIGGDDGSNTIAVQRVIEKANTPTIRRHQQEAVDLINRHLFDPIGTFDGEQVRKAVSTGVYALLVVQFLNSFYPEASVDYVHQCIDRAVKNIKRKDVVRNLATFSSESLSAGRDWLLKNAPMQTVLGMLFPEQYSYESAHQGIDAIRIITRLLNSSTYNGELEPPKRWRDLHDYVMAKEWKITTPNEALPQDLFPEPVKNGEWTFFQPRDVHQLADWGRAVRNCVGGTHYSEGIKKKKHFIVLAMVNKVPLITIQLSVDNGVMNVDQISKVSNQPLNSYEIMAYQSAFSNALKIRENQLKAV